MRFWLGTREPGLLNLAIYRKDSQNLLVCSPRETLLGIILNRRARRESVLNIRLPTQNLLLQLERTSPINHKGAVNNLFIVALPKISVQVGWSCHLGGGEVGLFRMLI